ncbi:MAG TPA: S1/P1 nuclease [Xanthomonadaceae bacterium]|nr:S1/P1 nuclease [Xanthomonadaceae bacterium]
MVRIALLVLLLAASQPVLAWSGLGHRLVAALAERHLTPEARRQVQSLLQGEADPTLAGIATWADALRDQDPDRFRATSRWHYVNSPGCDYVPARDCPDGNCVIAAIESQRAILADPSQPLAARRDALKFVVHFTGDVHEPMHASSRDDKGGNDYQISLRTDLQPEAYARKHYVDGVMATNLHSIWDYYILGTLGLDLAAYTNRLDALPWPPATTPLSGPTAWAGESCRLIETRHLYPEGHKLDRTYLDAMRPLAEQRVRQAAWRLAELLNTTLR